MKKGKTTIHDIAKKLNITTKSKFSKIIEGLILVDKNIKVYMAGWFSDKYTENIIGKYKNQIEYLGIL